MTDKDKNENLVLIDKRHLHEILQTAQAEQAIQQSSKKIRQPKWFAGVQYIRRTQVPYDYRVVFDIEGNPDYRKLAITHKIQIANVIINMHLKTEGKEYMTEEKYKAGVAYIAQHRPVRDALAVLFRNHLLATSQLEDLEDALQKARDHSDPAKIVKIYKDLVALNEAWERTHERKIKVRDKRAEWLQRKKEEEMKQRGVNVPSYVDGTILEAEITKPEEKE